MLTRILTGTIATCLFIPICYFSDYVVFPIAIGLFSLIAVYEMAKCLKFDKKLLITIPMYIIAFGLPILRFYILDIFKSGANSSFLTCAMILVFGMLIYMLAYVMFKKNTINVSEILTFYAMFVYIVGCFSSIVLVRYSGSGKYMYLLVFLGAWVCDTFAYFTGRFFGKHKLIPEISPKKTVEGSIGGIAFTIISFVIFGLIVNNAFDANLNYVKLCILGLVLSIVSQIGDLIASCVKRQYEIKDYGNLFPGHGGILDRFDSVMLTAPTLYILNTILSFF